MEHSSPTIELIYTLMGPLPLTFVSGNQGADKPVWDLYVRGFGNWGKLAPALGTDVQESGMDLVQIFAFHQPYYFKKQSQNKTHKQNYILDGCYDWSGNSKLDLLIVLPLCANKSLLLQQFLLITSRLFFLLFIYAAQDCQKKSSFGLEFSVLWAQQNEFEMPQKHQFSDLSCRKNNQILSFPTAQLFPPPSAHTGHKGAFPLRCACFKKQVNPKNGTYVSELRGPGIHVIKELSVHCHPCPNLRKGQY